MGEVAVNIAALRQRIAIAAEKSGRKPEEIEIIAVTKTVDVPRIREAMAEGITSLGENRVQELTAKYEEVGPEANWHLIGHLQTNKVKYIIDKVTLVHSLDRMSLAKELNKRAVAASRVVPVLVQVNIAEEETKFGLHEDEVIPFIEEVRSMPGMKIQGLMTIAPFTEEPETVRPVFRALKELAEKIKGLNFPEVEMRYLSMGMTNDFEVAIEEGANMIRVGSGIFGERS